MGINTTGHALHISQHVHIRGRDGISWARFMISDPWAECLSSGGLYIECMKSRLFHDIAMSCSVLGYPCFARRKKQVFLEAHCMK